jgi:hypothetical protein
VSFHRLNVYKSFLMLYYSHDDELDITFKDWCRQVRGEHGYVKHAKTSTRKR